MPRIVAWNVQHQGKYLVLNEVLAKMEVHAAFILEPGNGLAEQTEEINKKLDKKLQLATQVKQAAVLLHKTEKELSAQLNNLDQRALEFEGIYKAKTVKSKNGGHIVVMFLPGTVDGDKVFHIELSDRRLAVIKVSGVSLASGHSPYQKASGDATTWTAQALKVCKMKGIDVFMGDVNLMGKAEDKQGYTNMLASPTSKAEEPLDRVYLAENWGDTDEFTSGRVLNTNTAKQARPLTKHDVDFGCEDLSVHLETSEAKYFEAVDHKPVYVDF